MYSGPHIEKDGLIFGYDTGYGMADNNTSTRFYPGKPTVNIVPLSLSNSSWFNEIGSGIGRTLRSETLFGQPAYEFKSNDGQIWVSPFAFSSYDRSTNDLTLSVYAKNIGSSTVSMNTYFGGDYSTDSLGSSNTKSLPADNTWRRYSWTRFSSAMVTNQLEFRTANTGVVISCPQLEVGRLVTPIVNGTRSSTQSLIDLKRTRSINISGASFDSTGQPVFDGTDDVMSLGTNFNLNNKSFSVESIIKWDGGSTDTFFSYIDSAGGTQKNIHWRIYTSGQLRFDFYSNSINSSAGSIVADEYVHLVTTYNFGSDSCICYKNGEVLMAGSSGPFLGNDANSTAYVGAWATTQRFGGEIPILKIYNSALSASEIKQNFRAYRRRFNLS